MTGSVQVRSVMFTGQFPFRYGRLVLPACLEMESRYSTRTGREVFQDRTVTGQDGKFNQQSVKIHDWMFYRWVEPRIRYRVGVGR